MSCLQNMSCLSFLVKTVRNKFFSESPGQIKVKFLCSQKGEHIVFALSIRPSHFCLEHIS